MVDEAEIKRNVREFYDQVGWQLVLFFSSA